MPKKPPKIPKYMELFTRKVTLLGKETYVPYFNLTAVSSYLHICLLNKDFELLNNETKSEIHDIISIYSFEEDRPSA